MKNWPVKKLGEVCEVGAGNSAPQKERFFSNGIYPFFRTSDVGQIHIGNITESVDLLNEEGAQGLKLLPKGTILIPKSGASTFLNHRVIMGVEGYVSSHLATIQAHESVLSTKFLFYFFTTIKIQDLMQDHKYPSLNLPLIKNIFIPLPPLPEQQRIVKILDEAFEAIEKAKENVERNLRNTGEVFRSFLENIFTTTDELWQVKKLSDIGLIQTGSTPKTSEKKNFGQFVPFIKPGDFKSDGALFYGGDGLSEHGFVQSRKIEEGSILMVCIGATIGKTGYTDRTITVNQQINSLTPNPGVDTKFLYHQMCSKSFQKSVIFASGQATLPIINKTKWSQLEVRIPPLSEQRSLVTRLDALSAETKKLEAIYQRKLACLEELKKSLLQKAFAGEL